MYKINLNMFPYKTIRPDQKLVLDKINANFNKYKYWILDCGVGLGKSGIAKTIASSYNSSFLITATKQLQDQYINDFRDGSIKSIKGRSNYPCDLDSSRNCESGLCIYNKNLISQCYSSRSCPYYSAKLRAMKSPITLTSYSYFFTILNQISKTSLNISSDKNKEKYGWEKRDTVIFDECHLLEQQIISWAQLNIDFNEWISKYKLLKNYKTEDVLFTVRMGSTLEKSGYAENIDWIKEIYDMVEFNIEEFERKLELRKLVEDEEIENNDESKDKEEKIKNEEKNYNELKTIFVKLKNFMRNGNSKDWLIEPEQGGRSLLITPLYVGNLFKEFVSNSAKDKIFFLSATILNVKNFCEQFGIKRDEVGIIRVDSSFDPKKSPIVYLPSGKMNYSSIDNSIPKILENVDKILNKYPNDKGIIHSANYKLATTIYEELNNSRLLIKQGRQNNEHLLRQHINNNKPTVIISPSLTTGADLKDNLSRFQIILKLPFLSLGDKRVVAKMKIDNDWYITEMLRVLVQACGRSTRSANDFSTTYILDSSFQYWINKYYKLLPPQFLKRIIWKIK